MIKYFIGPMSKNIVDAINEFCNTTGNQIALIPSRRQVEWNGGYVNNWTTEEFSKYTNLIKQRDHSGPSQGIIDDDGYDPGHGVIYYSPHQIAQMIPKTIKNYKKKKIHVRTFSLVSRMVLEFCERRSIFRCSFSKWGENGVFP